MEDIYRASYRWNGNFSTLVENEEDEPPVRIIGIPSAKCAEASTWHGPCLLESWKSDLVRANEEAATPSPKSTAT